jgi:hypothetical protein
VVSSSTEAPPWQFSSMCSREPMARTTDGPSPAPTNVCLVPGGRCTKSHCRSCRSCPSMMNSGSPARTRKFSWSCSPWYRRTAHRVTGAPGHSRLGEVRFAFLVLPAGEGRLSPRPAGGAIGPPGVDHEPSRRDVGEPCAGAFGPGLGTIRRTMIGGLTLPARLPASCRWPQNEAALPPRRTRAALAHRGA